MAVSDMKRFQITCDGEALKGLMTAAGVADYLGPIGKGREHTCFVYDVVRGYQELGVYLEGVALRGQHIRDALKGVLGTC